MTDKLCGAVACYAPSGCTADRELKMESKIASPSEGMGRADRDADQRTTHLPGSALHIGSPAIPLAGHIGTFAHG